MKRILSSLLDLIFFISLLLTVAGIVIVDLYLKEHDITILNTLLQTQLLNTLLLVYAVFCLLYIAYYIFIPSILKGTIGQRLSGLSLESLDNTNAFRVFMRVFVGKFWDILLFPYSIFLLIKRQPLLSAKLSGIELVPAKTPSGKGFYAFVLLFTIMFISSLGISTYVYKEGVVSIMERYTDYRKMTSNLIEKSAYQDAAAVLEKYKKYNGETPDYRHLNCIIQGSLTTDLEIIPICESSINVVTDKSKQAEIVLLIAKLYAANTEYANAEKYFAMAWNDYGVRTIEMKDYVVVLSETGKTKEATDVLTEIAKYVPSDNIAMNKDLADLYQRIGAVDLALETYNHVLEIIGTDSNQDVVGEVNYSIGEIMYSKGKYTEAKANFTKAQTLNKDFAEGAKSYIILIDKLAKSITK